MEGGYYSLEPRRAYTLSGYLMLVVLHVAAAHAIPTMLPAVPMQSSRSTAVGLDRCCTTTNVIVLAFLHSTCLSEYPPAQTLFVAPPPIAAYQHANLIYIAKQMRSMCDLAELQSCFASSTRLQLHRGELGLCDLNTAPAHHQPSGYL